MKEMKEMKEMSIVAEKRQLLSSWTLELANWLITEHSMKRSEAFRNGARCATASLTTSTIMSIRLRTATRSPMC